MNWGCSLKEKLTKLYLYFYFSGMVLLRKGSIKSMLWWVKVTCFGKKKYKGKKCLNNWLQEIYRLANTADWSLLIGKETEKGLTLCPTCGSHPAGTGEGESDHCSWAHFICWISWKPSTDKSGVVSKKLNMKTVIINILFQFKLGYGMILKIGRPFMKSPGCKLESAQLPTGLFFKTLCYSILKKYSIRLSSFQCGASSLNHNSVINYDTQQDMHIISKPKNLWEQLHLLDICLYKEAKRNLLKKWLFHKPTTWMSSENTAAWQIYCLLVSSFHLL